MPPQTERLQKYLARSGVASRRKAERLIAEVRVKVNGKVISRPGTQVDPRRDTVVVDGVMEAVTDMEFIEKVVRANMEKQGLDPDVYMEKRMDYYRRSEGKDNAVKIFKIKTTDMQGKTAKTHN